MVCGGPHLFAHVWISDIAQWNECFFDWLWRWPSKTVMRAAGFIVGACVQELKWLEIIGIFSSWNFTVIKMYLNDDHLRMVVGQQLIQLIYRSHRNYRQSFSILQWLLAKMLCNFESIFSFMFAIENFSV